MTEIRVLRLEDTKNTKKILKNIKNRVKDLLHNDILYKIYYQLYLVETLIQKWQDKEH